MQSTKIPKYLERMLVLLSKEDKQYQENTVSSFVCFSFIYFHLFCISVSCPSVCLCCLQGLVCFYKFLAYVQVESMWE